MTQSAVVGSRYIEDKTGKEIVALFERTADHVMAHRKSMQLLCKQMEACPISPLPLIQIRVRLRHHHGQASEIQRSGPGLSASVGNVLPC